MTNSYKFKIISSLLIALGSGLVANVATAHSGDPVVPGYWQDTNKHVWKNNFGQCWRTGYWTPSMATASKSPPTSTEVARRAGVSRTTVSFVLNDVRDQGISDSTRAKVLLPAAEGPKMVSSSPGWA